MKQLTDASTEEKIMEAAKVVFMKYGLYGARMQDIANTAGINKALLHYYFRNKEKLFDKVFNTALERFFRQMDVLGDESLPIKERLFTYVDNIIDFYAEYPQMLMFIIKEMGNDPEMCAKKIAEAKKNKHIRLVAVLEEGIKKGEIKKIDTAMFMINLQSLCSYPFLASPVLRNSVKAQGKNYDIDFTPEKLKKVVKTFIDNTLG